MLYTTMIMTFTVGVDLGFVLGCFLLIFYHIASMNNSSSWATKRDAKQQTGASPAVTAVAIESGSAALVA